jgi:hypothetical protein
MSEMTGRPGYPDIAGFPGRPSSARLLPVALEKAAVMATPIE